MRPHAGQPDGPIPRCDWRAALAPSIRFAPAFATAEADYLLADGHLDDAARMYEEIIRKDVDPAKAYFGLAEVRRRQQRYADSIRLLRAAYSRTGRDAFAADISAKRSALLRAPRACWRRTDLQALRLRAQSGEYVSPLDIARAHARLGNVAQALAERSPGLVFLNVDRAWDPLRGEPAFHAALAQVVPAARSVPVTP